MFNISSFELFEKTFGPSLNIPVDCTVFELILILEEPAMHSPFDAYSGSNTVDIDVNVLPLRSTSGQLVFKTPAVDAVTSAMRYTIS